jgi:hypothetical protein
MRASAALCWYWRFTGSRGLTVGLALPFIPSLRCRGSEKRVSQLDFNPALTEPYAQWLGHKWVGDPNDVTIQVDQNAADAGGPGLTTSHVGALGLRPCCLALPLLLLHLSPSLCLFSPSPLSLFRLASATWKGGLLVDLQAVDR